MYTSLVIYAASALGMAALWLMMPKRRANRRWLGGLLGAIALGGFWLYKGFDIDWSFIGLPDGALPFYYIFSALGILGAVMVITNRTPVYAALWFVLVILSSAGLFLTLAADFMAFAMVIIYAGAILVTYMFVIMLAQRADVPEGQPNIDPENRFAREPLFGVLAGFLLMIALLRVGFEPVDPNRAGWPTDQQLIADVLGDRRGEDYRAQLYAGEIDLTTAYAESRIAQDDEVSSIEKIGVDLFRGHPLGIELAGIILLVALIGAVVIAKTTVHDEDTAVAPTARG
jgi:NADH-quinone oxidoreductase subunit J